MYFCDIYYHWLKSVCLTEFGIASYLFFETYCGNNCGKWLAVKQGR